MRKRLTVTVASTAVLAFGMVGTASAQVGDTCPDDTAATPTGSGLLEPDVGNLAVFGSLPGVGHGQADLDVLANGVVYNGSLNGQAQNLGYGDIENASATTDGVSGGADGQAPADLAAGEGDLNAPVGGTPSLTFQLRVGDDDSTHVCVSNP